MKINDKKGVSIMIGYVLLIGMIVVISFFVYGWLSTYVPKDKVECPADVSIFVKDVSCEGGELNLELQNNGLFSVNGYFISATTAQGQEIATLDLSPKGIGFQTFPGGELKPNGLPAPEKFVFDSQKCENAGGDCGDGGRSYTLYSLEITPIISQEDPETGKEKFVTCANEKIKEDLGDGCLITE